MRVPDNGSLHPQLDPLPSVASIASMSAGAHVRLDTRQLRNLAVVVQQGTFIRAAMVLNTSQPALSKSVRLLEEAVGSKLLERGRHGAKPTPHGKALVSRYMRIEAELRAATQELEALNGLSQGHLAIGTTRTVASYLVPTAVAALKAAKPKIDVKIVEDRAGSLIDALRDRRLDVIVGPIYGESIGDDVSEEFLFESHLVVVTRPGHPLAGRRHLTLKDLSAFQCIGDDGNNTVAWQTQLLLKANRMAGLNYAIRSNSQEASKDIIKHSNYFGLIPDVGVEADAQARLLQVTKLKAEGNAWPFGVRWRREGAANEVRTVFIQKLRTAAQRLTKSTSRTRRA